MKKRDRALREWLVEKTGENININFGSGYPRGILCLFLKSLSSSNCLYSDMFVIKIYILRQGHG